MTNFLQFKYFQKIFCYLKKLNYFCKPFLWTDLETTTLLL